MSLIQLLEDNDYNLNETGYKTKGRPIGAALCNLLWKSSLIVQGVLYQ